MIGRVDGPLGGHPLAQHVLLLALKPLVEGPRELDEACLGVGGSELTDKAKELYDVSPEDYSKLYE